MADIPAAATTEPNCDPATSEGTGAGRADDSLITTPLKENITGEDSRTTPGSAIKRSNFEPNVRKDSYDDPPEEMKFPGGAPRGKVDKPVSGKPKPK